MDYILLLTSVGTVVTAFATVCLACVTFRQLSKLNRQLELQAFNSLLEQIGTDEARWDRGIVAERVAEDTNGETILGEYMVEMRKSIGESGFEERLKVSEKLRIARAIERTIVTLDRVGFILVGDKGKVSSEPPKWIWTIALSNWRRLGQWVKYRQKENPYYGHYFELLAEEAKKRLKQGNA